MKNVRDLVEEFFGKRVLVLGDIMLDEYVRGRAVGTSAEAPVPVIRAEKTEYVAGGAANVAANIKALGGEACLVGVIGRDHEGAVLSGLLRKKELSTEGVIPVDGRPTTLKTRIMAQQQIVRVDRELNSHLDAEVQEKLLAGVLRYLDGAAALVVSDYEKGVVVPALLRRVLTEARRRELQVVVDPKGRDVSKYVGANLIMPNRTAIELLLGLQVVDDDSAERAVIRLKRETNIEAILLTRGEDGMTLLDGSGEVIHLPTCARHVFDVTGASDTVAAVLGLSLASQRPLQAAARLANVAAGIAVEKTGTQVVSAGEVLAAVRA